jgi:drug/metabolite transporter (DMT)-like permease
MSPLALLLLIVAAFLHAGWNLLLKQADEKHLASWWAMLMAAGIMLPALFFTGLPARSTWLLVVLSALLEMIYFITLASGYTIADYSLIYPLGRGAAPAFTTVWSILFLHERPTVGGWLGLGTIIAGLLVVGGSAWLTHLDQRPSLKGVLLALFVALTISIYTVIDGAAMKLTAPFPYIVMVFFLMPVFSAPLVFKRYGWTVMKAAWRKGYLRLLGIGLISLLAYLLVLAAYAISPVSYSGAIREVSVVVAAFAGWKFLHERLGGVRLAGAGIIFAGILVIVLFG